jgi:uncharacterized membrane protein
LTNTALTALRSLIAPLALVMPNMAQFLTDAPRAVWGHILFAPLASALAPFQMNAGLRARRPALHRWMGRLYTLSITVAALSALALVPTSVADSFARAGFVALALAWMGTTGRGIWLAMSGDLAAHRVWMQRSVALTFGAVTLRLIMAPLMAMGWSVAQTYDITAWGCWVPNLILLELWRRAPRRHLA